MPNQDSNQIDVIISPGDPKMGEKKSKTESELYGVGYLRIMSYYKPVIVVVITLISSAIYSLAFPVIGLVSAKF